MGRLETKLREIKDLKSRKYVGTQEAWRYLERVDRMDKNPIRVARAINEIVIAERGYMAYEATPERIVGFVEMFDKLLNHGDRVVWNGIKERLDSTGLPGAEEFTVAEGYRRFFDEEQDRWTGDDLNDVEKIWLNGYDRFRRHSIFNRGVFWNSVLGHYSHKVQQKPQLGKLVKCLAPVFIAAHDVSTGGEPRHVSEDLTFGLLATVHAAKRYFARPVIDTIQQVAARIDWDGALSRYELARIETAERDDIFFTEVSLKARYERMHRDMVANRLESRRELLTDWLDIKKAGSYEGAVAIAQRSLKDRQDRFAGLKSIGMPEVTLQSEERMILESTYYLELIQSDKNFINAYLAAV